MDKQQAQNIIRETFESSFDKSGFTGFIKNLLNRIDDAPFTYQGNYIPDAYKQYIKTLERIGKFDDGENSIDILVINLQKETSLERARAMQRNFIAWYLNGSRGGMMKDAALAAFVSPGKEDWRFSLVKMDYKFEKTKAGRMKVKEEFTPARRWSFLVGANEKSHTAQSRLVNILANDEQAPSLEEIEKAFDIETVTKEFFINYRELFLRTKEELDKLVKNDPKIKADFEAKGVDTVNFAKKLLGQIVFLYFLQKKGWFGVERDADWGDGSKHFLRELFLKKHGSYRNFFNDILEPLFYEALRIDRSHDDDYYSRFDCKIPFLNGGLFDPIGNYDWVHTDIIVPDKLFSNINKTKEGDAGDGIIDIFDRYNFTVKEDEPLEKEVAIDPELLGKAYEKFNSIRPDNFDEFKKALKSGKKGEENKFNKKFGVYYTPRDIVHYMCQQSLINYIANELEGKVNKDDIEPLIHTGELVSENEVTALIKGRNIKEGKQKTSGYKLQLSESIYNNADLIDDKLADITVCDPAVGSGAFPVGMMSEIVKTRNVLSAFIRNKNRTPYEFKRRCIEHSLYGVDIDPGAVEIAKLRLWLSLVVDEEDIKNIKPLPNLEYKIVCGNSLIGVDKGLFNFLLFNELEELKPLFFNETNPTRKQEYKKHIDDLIDQITNGHKEFDFEVYFSEVFHEKGGFDVIIANPPYVYNRNLSSSERKLLQHKFKSADDLYVYFIYESVKQLKDFGTLSFITPNTYFTLSTRTKFRSFLLEHKNLVFTYSGFCFSDAYVETMIMFLTKEKSEKNDCIKFVQKPNDYRSFEVLYSNISVFLDNIYCRFFWPTKINLEINKKINKPLLKLSLRFQEVLNGRSKNTQIRADYINSLKFNELTLLGVISNGEQGLVTGNNSKYIGKISRSKIFDEKTEKDFIAKLAENIKGIEYEDFLKNRHHYYELAEKIKKQRKKPDCFGKFFLYKIVPSSTIKNYSELSNGEKRDGGVKDMWVYYNRGNTKGLRWFVPYTESINWSKNFVKELKEGKETNSRWQGDDYYDKTGFAWVDYFTKKIKAFFVEEGVYSKNVVKLNSISKLITNKYIVACLNSTFISYYVKQFITSTHTLQINDGRLIPIKTPDKDSLNSIESMVDKILAVTKNDDYFENSQKQARVNALEAEIDQLVYKLYDLTPEEIKIVEEENKNTY